ncbi:MAG TPA: molybdate ABC transporter substrate-binding protein [Candidatus Dormibacteraeota bacterium]|nr:molybdate ABC transporter substrate-binding protein [Candidatus Dormibacteraeota bacterium]
MPRPISLLVSAAALAVAACGSSPTSGAASPSALSGTISVFAAASLTDAFNALGQAFQQKNSGVTVKFNYAGTPTLVTQIEQGAQADVFASADTTNMDRLKTDGFTSGTPAVFAHNQLEIVVAPGNPKGISSLADLAKPGVIYISEGPTVPAGKYSLQSLQKAGVTVTPKSLETDVKSVISKIELGEADAGIVYTTDVKAAGSRVTGVPIADQYNVVATYPIVSVKGTQNSTVADAFIAFVESASGQSTLGSFGFQHA